jgi:hypothetical protein
LNSQSTDHDDLLFPISARSGGIERKAAGMMRIDLAATPSNWLLEAKQDPELHQERERSDMLRYNDRQNRFADFHTNRSSFITNPGKTGVAPRTAQTLACPSDVRLTKNTYSHTELAEKRQAIDQLHNILQRCGSAPEAQNELSFRRTDKSL